MGASAGDSDPYGDTRVVWNGAGGIAGIAGLPGIGVATPDPHDGGEGYSEPPLQSMLAALHQMVTQANALQINAALSAGPSMAEATQSATLLNLTPLRMPQLAYRRGGYTLIDIDPVSGAERSLFYTTEGQFLYGYAGNATRVGSGPGVESPTSGIDEESVRDTNRDGQTNGVRQCAKLKSRYGSEPSWRLCRRGRRGGDFGVSCQNSPAWLKTGTQTATASLLSLGRTL